MAKRTAPLGSFRVPAPKGPKLDPRRIPTSSVYVPPDPVPDVPEDESELAAFGGEPRGRKSKAVTGDSPLARARRRTAHLAPEPEEFVDTDDEGGGEGEDQFVDELTANLFDEPVPSHVEILAKQRAERTAMQNAQGVQTHVVPMSPFKADKPTSGAAGPTSPTGYLGTSVKDLYGRPVMIEDVDRLWDWLRTTDGATPTFFGQTFRTSIALHSLMASFTELEPKGLAYIRAVCHGPHHLGFAMLAPVLTDDRMAMLHIYLRAEVRGQFGSFVKPLIEMAEQVVPGFHLVAFSTDPLMQRLQRQALTPLGFVEHVMFVR